MDYTSTLRTIFKNPNVEFCERMKIAEMSFGMAIQDLPPFIEICKFVYLIPKRDKIAIVLKDDGSDSFVISSEDMSNEEQYKDFCQIANIGESVKVSIIIEKGTVDSRFSVYNFASFSADILSLSTEQQLAAFSLLFSV